eukprot:6189049-Pleurochrysis_carterae.AAC.1
MEKVWQRDQKRKRGNEIKRGSAGVGVRSDWNGLRSTGAACSDKKADTRGRGGNSQEESCCRGSSKKARVQPGSCAHAQGVAAKKRTAEKAKI